jgi:soluble lytic murein transglycosylase-like protein
MNNNENLSLIALARQIGAKHSVNPSLVCAVIEQESGWDPWAMRFEPIFERRYIRPALPLTPSTEELSLAISWGLMQVMGATAREHGFTGRFLNALCDPEVGVSVGCVVLLDKLNKAKGDIRKGLLSWNGGANSDYAAQVLARMPNYE